MKAPNLMAILGFALGASVPLEALSFVSESHSLTRITGLALLPLVWATALGAKRMPLRRSWLIAFPGMVLVTGVSFLWSSFPDASVDRILMLGRLQILAATVAIAAQNRSTFRAVAMGYVIGGLAAAGITMIDAIGGPANPAGRASLVGYDPNYNAVNIALVVPFSLLAWPNMRPRMQFLMLAGAAAGIWATGSRTGILAWVIGGLACAFTQRQPISNVFSISARKLALGAATVFAGGALLLQVVYSRASIAGTPGSLSGRESIWAAGMSAFREQPLLGHGAGTFGLAVEPVLGRIRDPHGSWVEILVEYGLVGIMAFIIFAGFIAWWVSKSARDYRAGWFAALGILAVASIVLTWTTRKPTWLLVGLLASRGSR